MRAKTVVFSGAVGAAGVLLFVFDEVIFGTPVLAMAKWLGPWTAFFVLLPIYFIFDYMLGTLALNGVKRCKSSGRQNKWSKKFSDTRGSNVGKFSYWLMTAGGSAGFVACSYMGTAFLTMPIVYLLGRRRHLRQLTAISAAIYAITFVGQYAGLGALIF